jgi:HD-GYP domain-containing protein (c-di-GMP phosphodiesterase class II)
MPLSQQYLKNKMKNKNIRKDIALFLKSQNRTVVRKWSDAVFDVAGHKRDEGVISKKTHKAGMELFFKGFISDIEYPRRRQCEQIFNKLIFKDYLSASSSVDVIQGLMLLRNMLIDIVTEKYSSDVKKLKLAYSIIIEEISKSIVYVSDIYKKRDFTRLETIMMYGKKMVSVHNLNKLCDLILEAAIIESDSDRASLMLLGGDGFLRIKSSLGIPKGVAAKTKVKVGSGISGRVAKTGETIIISKGFPINKTVKKSLRGLGLKSALSIPIMSDNTIHGVLNLGKIKNKHFFDKDDAELLSILAYEAGTAISNSRLFEEMRELYEGSIISLAAAIDARDHYTHGHSNRVANIALAISKVLNLPDELVGKIRLASMLHDIGKIGVPDRVLLKPGPLTQEEFEIIKKHPVYAVNILKHLPRLKDIVPIVYHEHEHYDGKGYVEGIKGKAIPFESRIISVADAYEAMTSNRPYRKAMTKQQAIKELKRNTATQFDPVVVNAFLKVVKNRRLAI